MYIVDRIEGNIAVVENGDEFIDVYLSNIDGKCIEGSVLILQESGRYLVDQSSTDERRKSLAKRTRNLFSD